MHQTNKKDTRNWKQALEFLCNVSNNDPEAIKEKIKKYIGIENH